MKKKILALVLAVTVLVGAIVGGTLAYLSDTDSAVNVATVGNVKIEQHQLQRAEGVAHKGTLEKGDLVNYVQGQKLFPSYPAPDAINPYTAEPTDLLYWGPYVTDEGAGNGLWSDEKLTGAMDSFIFVENTGKSEAYYRTWIALECPDGAEYGEGPDEEFMMNINGNSRFDFEEIGYKTIDGQRYYISVANYTEKLVPGEISRPSLLQVIMTDKAGNALTDALGDTYEILAFTEAVQVENMPSAVEALNAAFGDPDEGYMPWDASFDLEAEAPVLVDNAADLATAIAAGKNVALTADVEVDGNGTIEIADGAEVELNLNGHSISGVSSEAGGNRKIFTVKGDMNVVGEGTVSFAYTGTNMEWNNLSAAFSVEGGTLTLDEGVKVVNLGGTDMAYAVDVNSTLGKTVLNVEGATLYSTYIGVRIFNNHKTDKGIVNYNSGVIYGAKNGYDIWAQLMGCPAENAVVNIADGIKYTTADKSGTMYYIEDKAAVVATAETLASALAAGENVVLATDVALDNNTTIVIGSGKEAALDLNGNTLSAENTNTATHNFMIDVKGGELTISNGTVSMKHTGTNMGWNGATTVIDVTAGGVLNLDGVTVKNEGGTDMNFGVHLNNWGDATLNADNCVFDATYCGVRVFNSGPDMNNVKITNSTIIGASRAFWVHNYTSADLGGKTYSNSPVAYDKAVVDARLNLDIYNNNNTFEITGTAKSPIRYGFNETVYYDANGNIVP